MCEKERIGSIKKVLEYLNRKELRTPLIAKIRWFPGGEESVAIIDNGRVVFDSHLWFYGAKLVERKVRSYDVKSVHWSDYKRFYRVLDVYNVYGIKIATWTYDVRILTEISPSSRIPLSGTGYIDGTVSVSISREGFTCNDPAVIIGEGPDSAVGIVTNRYVTHVRITSPQSLSGIQNYDHFAAGTGSEVEADNGKDGSASVSLSINLGPFTVAVSPSGKFISAKAGDTYGREIELINKVDTKYLGTGLSSDYGLYYDGGHMDFSLKFRVGDSSFPSRGSVQVQYKIKYAAVYILEYHTLYQDSYTADLSFKRG